ncbi:MAG: hypothetical protein NVSMB56_07900 [Pyrinomonadaceae bacterium]
MAQNQGRGNFGGDRYKNYVPVAERLEQFYAKFSDGKILTSIIEHDREAGFVLVRAEVYRHADDAQPAATGHAYEYKDAGFTQKSSYIEVGECVPLDTEILTIEGWKHPQALQVDELALSYNIENDAMVWTPIERVSFFSDQPLLRVWNEKGFEAFCTPQHTWAVEYKVAQDHKCYVYRRLRRTCELKKCDALITSAPMPEGSLSVTPHQAALMGWAITDGWFSRPGLNQFRLGIGQSKPQNIPTILNLHADMPHTEILYPPTARTFPTGRTYDCLPDYQWSSTATAGRNLLAAFRIAHESDLAHVVPRLTFEARAALLEAMLLGDGEAQGRFGMKKRAWDMDVFTMLCALQGVTALKRHFSTAGDVPLQSMKRTKRVYASSLQVEEAGRGDVWCPTLRYGTWVARFANGLTTITGNTSAVGRALAFLGFETKRGIASREEMEKFTRSNVEEIAPPQPPPSLPKKTNAQTPDAPPQAATTPSVATEAQKKEILARLELLHPNDRAAQRKILEDGTGKRSRDDLTQEEARNFIAALKKSGTA